MKRIVALIISLLPTVAAAMSEALTEADGLSSNCVWCCIQDKRGYLWIGTDAGLDRYDGVRIKSFSRPTRCLAELDGIIWAGTEEGLWTYSQANGVFSQLKSTTKYGVNIISRVNAIAVTMDNLLWAGTEGQGLFVYNTISGELTQHSVQIQFVRVIVPEDDGRVIVTDQDGYSHLFSAEGEYLRPLQQSAPCPDYSFTDREGTRWIPTEENGLMKIPKANTGLNLIPLPRDNDHFPSIPLTEDASGNIIAGIGDKLYVLSPGENKLNPLGIDSPHGNITRVLSTAEGIWVGTDADCIWRYIPQTRRLSHYHAVGQAHSLYRTRQGVFMAGTDLGVFSWDPVKDRLSRDLNRTDIQILIDGEKPGKSSYPKEFEVVSQSSVVAMSEDASGHYLYLATSNRGIFRKNLITGSWEHILTSDSKSPSLPWNKLTTLLRTSDGTIIAGTDGKGLWSMASGSLSFNPVLPSYPRLRESKIYGIMEDSTGILWICSSSGLWRMDSADGSLDSFPVKAESILYATNGKLYLAGHEGIFSLQPQSKSPSSQWPPTVIQEMAVGDSTLYIPPGGLSITLSYPQNSFAISLAALSFTDPSQNLYSWQLSGIDPDWTSPATLSTASYKSVRPGEYVFRVRGSDDTIHITVRPPWWRTGWAVSLYIILILATLTLFYSYGQRAIKRRYNEMMKKQEEEREKALYKQRIRFFIGLVHEIRTPLTLIRLQHEKDAPGKSDTITRNLDYMQETIDKILTYDKNTAGDIQMLRTRLDLRDVVASVTDTFRESASERIAIETVLEDSPVIVNADEDMITKILTNLLSNALKYAKDRILVTVGTEEGKNAVVCVSDNGPGVRKDLREKIFGMFFTAPDDKVAEASGIGVGLAYARQLAVAHEGSLSVEDSVPGGASFVLRLPILEEIPSPAAAQPQSVSASSERLTVLVVEDSRELLETLQKDLSQWYDILTAPNGSVALRIIEEKGVDVVVSDVMMPVMDGFSLCRAIKGQLAYSHIPVILLTARVTLDAKSEGMESGADAYLEKPFTIRQLRGQIDNLIRLREAFRRSIAKGTEQESVPSGPEVDFIRSINESIEKQLNEENFSIETLAYDMNMSRTNFFRKFKALTGETPNDYLKNYRLDRSAQLIRSGARINEAAESVGFTSSSYFAKCFKARFSILPKDFARQNEHP